MTGICSNVAGKKVPCAKRSFPRRRLNLTRRHRVIYECLDVLAFLTRVKYVPRCKAECANSVDEVEVRLTRRMFRTGKFDPGPGVNLVSCLDPITLVNNGVKSGIMEKSVIQNRRLDVTVRA